MMPPCHCCSVVVRKADIQPDGMYIYGPVNLVSFRCGCGTNRALRFQDAPQELRRAAMLADLAGQEKNEMTCR